MGCECKICTTWLIVKRCGGSIKSIERLKIKTFEKILYLFYVKFAFFSYFVTLLRHRKHLCLHSSRQRRLGTVADITSFQGHLLHNSLRSVRRKVPKTQNRHRKLHNPTIHPLQPTQLTFHQTKKALRP